MICRLFSHTNLGISK